MRDYNEYDAVCTECSKKRNTPYCEWCQTFTCVHYSLWADDDPPGLDGEQLVHRCNDCESELVEIGAFAVKSAVNREQMENGTS